MSESQTLADRYQFGSGFSDLIGKGGMGAVYRGLDVRTRQPVAIKLLRPEIAASAPWLVERFIREGEALRRLNHPNIVKMLDAVQEGENHYIIMEYVPGGSLHDLIIRQPEGRLPIDLALKIGLELADALTRAHHVKIVHRDIKPANVLLAADGTPRLTDFGIARLSDLTGVTGAGEVVGTYSYLAPEGFHGQELDERADIWSFGVLLYEMLTGDVPFHNHNPGEMMHAVLKSPLPDLEKIRPDAPVAMVDLIYRMLEKNPSQRIGSARLVGAELEAIVRGVDTDFHPLVYLASFPSVSATPTLLNPYETAELTPRYHNLPTQTTPFLGREPELAEMKSRLENPACRLLTLIGPGGIGKTRLAIEAAQRQSADFADGVYFVSFMTLDSPELLVSTITDALGFTYSGSKDPKAQLLDFLRDSDMLLLIDNFENMMEAADLINEILPSAPGVKILVTSRESLNLHGEWLLEVHGMDFPQERVTPDFERYSAVQLFVQGAGRVLPDYTPFEEDRPHILKICQLVGGMPLAIELASSWVRVLSCEEIAREIEHNLDFLETTMRDIPERHRSMRAVFEYSWQGLSPKQQDVFRKLSVFRGGFHRDAAQHIANATLGDLSGLVNKSLLYRTPTGRYEIHALLRQYAARKLDEVPAMRVHVGDLHCTYYADFIRKREDILHSPRQAEAVVEVAVEIENVRAALEWAVEHGRLDKLGMCLKSMFLFYDIRGWFMVGEELLRKVVTHMAQLEPTPERDLIMGQAMRYQALFYQTTGFYEQSRVILNKALDIFQALVEQHYTEAQPEIGHTLAQIGSILYAIGDYDEARRYYDESIAIHRELGVMVDVSFALRRLGDIATVQGDYPQAKRILEETMSILMGRLPDTHKEQGTLRSQSLVLANLGDISVKLGDYPSAKSQFEQCRDLAAQMGDKRVLGIALVNLGRVALALGDYDAAVEFCRESQSICAETGHRWGESFALTYLGVAHHARGEFQDALRLYQDSLSICEDIGNRWGTAFNFIYRGQTAVVMGMEKGAQRDFYEALAIASEIQALPLMLEALLGIAGGLLREGQREQALAVLHTVARHPASEFQTRQQAESLLERVGAKASSGYDLYEVVRDLLTQGDLHIRR
jgi:serine/threonine protein kinase/tetratricopeptide (TPR) repeat protein